MTMTARITDTAAALTTEIAALAADYNVKLDLRDGDAGGRLLRCLPWNDDSWDAPVAMDTHALRDLYRAILGERTMCADLRRMAISNTNDELDGDGKRYCDMSGSYASVAHVLGLCMALAQWDRNEAEYAAECEAWGERYAEAGSDHVYGGGNSLDAHLVASQVVGPKPTRWWVHAG